MKLHRTRKAFAPFRALLTVLLLLPLTVTAFAAGEPSTQGGSLAASVIYGVTAGLSLALLCVYCWFFRKKEIWFLLLFSSVFLADLGYFALSISRTLQEALLANRIAYLGSVFLPLCMLMIIADVCHRVPGKPVTAILVCVSVLIFLLAASGGYLDLYYSSVSLTFVNGAATLIKEYGPLHILYLLYLLVYLLSMVGLIVYAVLRKNPVPLRYAAFLLTIVLLNMAVWFVEQQISGEFEFLSVSYIVSCSMLLLLYDLLRSAPVSIASAEDAPAPSLPSSPLLEKLTTRELDVLQLMLENKKRKEIAEALFVTENTIKKHTAHIYEKLEVSDRSELLQKLSETT